MLTLSKKKASIKYDENAKKIAEEIKAAIAEDNNIEKIAQSYTGNDLVSYEIVEGVDINNLDSGRAVMAASLEKEGDASDYFVSRNGDGYYFVKLTGLDGDKINYVSIWIRFKWLDDEMARLRKDGHVKEMIDLNVDSDEE